MLSPGRRESLARGVKRRIVRSGLEDPTVALQLAAYRRKGRREPELARLHGEHAAIRQAFRLLVAPDSCCADVGAHIGSMLSQLCRLAPAGRHTAVEADPDKAEWLQGHFPDVNVVNAAVSDRSGEVSFGRNPAQSGYSRVVRPDEIEGAVDQGLEVITVPAVRLDQVMADQPVDVVKVDVEGHELAALRGAPTLLGVTRPRLVVEAGWVDGDPWASDLADLYRLLVDEHRYRLWTVVDFVAGRRPLTLERFIDTHLWPFEAWNFVALPDGDVLEARVRG